jgi:outer membrane protein
MRMILFGAAALAAGFAPAPSAAQEPARLTLAEALRLAQQNNGEVRSALQSYQASIASTRVSGSAFLPTITPSFSRTEGRLERHTGQFQGGSNLAATDLSVAARWTILDNGLRRLDFQQSLFSQFSAEAQALQALRSTLFSVYSGFYDALRSQEVLRVRAEQLVRSQTILRQTEAEIAVGATAPVDRLQAQADALNAEVEVLTAETQVSSTAAALKAVVGIDSEADLRLEPTGAQPEPQEPLELSALILEGLQNRPDLQSQRQRIRAQRAALASIEKQGGLSYSLEARASRSFADDVFDRAAIVLSASYPLYDGARTRSRTEAQRLTILSLESSLEQTERDIRAEIETAWKTLAQNRRRIEAATLAERAARANFEASQERRRQGAGDLITVITAQSSLVTAEANLVQATYDFAISQIRLSLASGRPLPGEGGGR